MLSFNEPEMRWERDIRLSRRKAIGAIGVLMIFPLAGLWHSMVGRHNRQKGLVMTGIALDDIPRGLSVHDDLGIVRQGDEIKVLSLQCTHLGCRLRINEKGNLACPCHGSEFSAGSGLPLRGPAVLPLVTFPHSIEEGIVLIRKTT